MKPRRVPGRGAEQNKIRKSLNLSNNPREWKDFFDPISPVIIEEIEKHLQMVHCHNMDKNGFNEAGFSYLVTNVLDNLFETNIILKNEDFILIETEKLIPTPQGRESFADVVICRCLNPTKKPRQRLFVPKVIIELKYTPAIFSTVDNDQLPTAESLGFKTKLNSRARLERLDAYFSNITEEQLKTHVFSRYMPPVGGPKKAKTEKQYKNFLRDVTASDIVDNALDQCKNYAASLIHNSLIRYQELSDRELFNVKKMSDFENLIDSDRCANPIQLDNSFKTTLLRNNDVVFCISICGFGKRVLTSSSTEKFRIQDF